ncbi:Efflux RND transporter permease subunit [Sulfidibacter corallicola]|uniref:Efflux RND transporter permease subunit n=1 Tax=Sulfidibacter corallicola TaxID=2818388 RepID=A0A8A4TWH2_SULCO|nr:efflux RND transporter permease subunit [Sulfidibacter corallicola]QTD53531.1 efflux RND transporter permease subunit [Sulfidibacter corallicola]
MNITRTAIEKNRITLVFLSLILISGLLAYKKMPRSQDPGFIVRTALVQTYFPGASPERVEKLVTDRLEKAIQEMPELDSVVSQSKTGVSILYVNIKESYKDMRPIWDSLRRKVERETPDLPDGVVGPFVNDEFGDIFGTIVSITGDGFSFAELKEIADTVRDEILMLENVAKVDIIGDQEERVFLEYNNARLAELGISPTQLQQILSAQNILISGGSLRVEDERIYLEPTGNYETVTDIEETIINLPGREETVYLKDLLHVYRDYIDPPQRQAYSSGEPCLILAISMREGGNIIDLGKEVKTEIKRLKGIYPIGIEFDIVSFEPDAVAEVIANFTGNLGQSVLVVMISMILFLGFRTGLIVASLIPSTILTTFLVMGAFDIGLDQISLAALIISLGLLVDNAIVMAESIMVNMAEGQKPIEAAVASSMELKIPLLTSSLTTSAAFLPIFLAKSATGEYTASLFKVVTISLLCSWILALTLIPLLCVLFLKVKPRDTEEGYDTKFYQQYRNLLLFGLRNRVLSIALILGTFYLALQGFKFIPQSFFPDSDERKFTVEIERSTGTAIEETSRMVRRVDQWMGENLTQNETRSGITNWSSYVGEGAPRFNLSYAPDPPTPGLAFMLVNVDDYRVIDDLANQLRGFVREHFPDAKITAKALPKGPVIENPIEIRLSGRDNDELYGLVDRVKAKLRETPGTFNIDDNWGLKTKKLIVHVNQARARRAGLSSQDIAVSLQTVFTGLETTQYREDDKTIPIVLRSVAADRQDLSKLEQLSVYSLASGQSVPLRQIADIEVVWEPPVIRRYNRLRTITVSCKLEKDMPAANVESLLIPWLAEYSRSWPPGYRWELGGEYETSGESNKSIADQLPIAAMIILLLLVSQFNSVRRPIIILMTLPLGIIGVVIGMLVTGASLGFMAFLGIISLSGIVINNAIVLIDRIRLEIEENGHSPSRAVIESAQRRLRPILLTTVTTLAGLLPLWYGGGPMFEPMAITIIFGLMFATVLTLGVVPLLYSMFFGVSFKTFDYHDN